LEVAFSRLVADWTVERVIGEEKFQYRFAALLGLVTLRMDDHPFSHGRIAGDLELRVLLHVHQTDPAVSSDGQARVIAVARDENPQLLRSLDDGGARGALDLPAVNGQGRHAAASVCRRG